MELLLLIIKNKQCSACEVLNNILNEFIEIVKKHHNTLKVEIIDFKDRDIDNLNINKYNIAIKKFVISYPFIGLFKLNEWKESLKNTKVEYKFQNVDIFSKYWTYKNGNVFIEPDNTTFTFRNLLHVEKWAKDAFLQPKLPFSVRYESQINERNINPPQQNMYINTNNTNNTVNTITGDSCPTIIFKARRYD